MAQRHLIPANRLADCISAGMHSVSARRVFRRLLRLAASASILLASPAFSQLSLSSAVDLALRSNPRVLSAQDDVKRAQAVLTENHDVYIPAVNMGAGLGQAYGYLPNPPTLFTVTASSLVYGSSQRSYIRSAQAGLRSAELSLQDVRESLAQDTALAFLAVGHDEQREKAIQQQLDYGNSLVRIVQERLDAGHDTQIDLTRAQLTAAQLRLDLLHAQDESASDREHLARLVGVPLDSIRTDAAFPTVVVPLGAPASPAHPYASAAVASAFANAEAKQLQAKGDNTFRFRPQVSLAIQYNRYATFTNSFGTLQNFSSNSTGGQIGSDEAAFGVQITLPFFDKERSSKARESDAQASKALHDAQAAQNDALDGQSKLRHSIAELQAQSDVASLQQQLAQQQLEVLQVQLQNGTGNPNGQQMTPKDEQTARISERDKYLAAVDATYKLHQTEIQLMRQTGQLMAWLQSAAAAPATSIQSQPSAPTPQH